MAKVRCKGTTLVSFFGTLEPQWARKGEVLALTRLRSRTKGFQDYSGLGFRIDLGGFRSQGFTPHPTMRWGQTDLPPLRPLTAIRRA